MQKKSKKEVQKRILDLCISCIKQGKSPYEAISELGITKSLMSFYINKLKKTGIIKNIGYGVWELEQDIKAEDVQKEVQKRSPKKSSLGMSNETNIHALNINIPILSGELSLVRDFDGYMQKTFNNWLPEYRKFIVPIGFTIRNNNNKSIDLLIFSRKIIRVDEIYGLGWRTITYAHKLLSEKGVKIDVFSARVVTKHISMRNDDLNKVLNKGTTIEVALGRSIEKIFPCDKDTEAIAWTDASPFRGIESNDIQYIRNYVVMPEKVDALFNSMIPFSKNIEAYAEQIKLYEEQIKLHLKVEKGTLEAQKEQNKIQSETLKTLKLIQNSFKRRRDYLPNWMWKG